MKYFRLERYKQDFLGPGHYKRRAYFDLNMEGYDYDYYNPLARDYANMNSFGNKQRIMEKYLNDYYGLLGKPREVIHTKGEKVLFWLYFTPFARMQFNLLLILS
eukprot:TRINITY_DN88363_c0_g1_i1.p13 TRINITY_DN88363_c0_g1~~TRINITY_DN88363_c0_g1_i1.p13  ORF type:complete len:104 (+),score=7.13 TRINITY_DN88363_c0_g1_i1:2350-2661(+)